MERPASGGYERLFQNLGWDSTATPNLDLRLNMESPPHPPPPPPVRHDYTHTQHRHLPPPPPPPLRPAIDEHGTFISEVNPVTGNAYSMNSMRRALPTPPTMPAASTSGLPRSSQDQFPGSAGPNRPLGILNNDVQPASNRYSRVLPNPPVRAASNNSSGGHGPSNHGYGSDGSGNHAALVSDGHGHTGVHKTPPRPLPRPVSHLPTHIETSAPHYSPDFHPEQTRSPISYVSSTQSSHQSNGNDYFHRDTARSTPPSTFSSHSQQDWNKVGHRHQVSEVSSMAHDGTSPASVLDHYYTSESPNYVAHDLPAPGTLGVEDRDSGPSTPRPTSAVFDPDAPGPSRPVTDSGLRTARQTLAQFGSVHFPSAQSYANEPARTESRNQGYDEDPPFSPGYSQGYSQATSRPSVLAPSWSEQAQEPTRWVQTKLLLHQAVGYYDDEDGGIYEDYASQPEEEEIEEVNEIRFFNPAFLSEAAVQLRDRVSRGHHVKAGITWVGTFTGRDLVTTIQSFLPSFVRESPADRRFALATARSLQSQLWVVEVDWDDKPIRDSEDVVFKFMSEMKDIEFTGELPSGVLTNATKCYSPSCVGDGRCYAPRCPYKTIANTFISMPEEEAQSSFASAAVVKNATDWTEDVDPVILAELTDRERDRQTAIRKVVLLEEKYEKDLAAVEQIFITPLMTANPPILSPYHHLEDIVLRLFGNIQEIRRESRRIIDNFAVRLREQSPLIRTVGDIMLEASTEFRNLYPVYTENLPRAEELLTETLQDSPKFAQWMREVTTSGDHRWDLRYLLNLPANHLREYPKLLQDILTFTPPDDPDFDFLHESLSSIESIANLTQLKLWQSSKGRNEIGKKDWQDFVPAVVREGMSKMEIKRQNLIWELIHGEMTYVADLEAIETVFINPLREAERPVIDRARQDIFIDAVFHNYRSLLEVHRRLLEDLQERQVQQHPQFGAISDLILDAVLNWHEAYQEYFPHFPLAKAAVDEEIATNPAFVRFLEECRQNPLSNRKDIFNFIHRPIPRLTRYALLLDPILKCQEALGPPDHPDITTIPQIKDLIDKLAKAGQKGLAINEAKIELRQLKTSLDGGKYGPHAVKGLDLLNPMRELIHSGIVYRHDRQSSMSSGSELKLFLFDNYFVLCKQNKGSTRNKNGPIRYTINRRPTPLELLTLGDFDQPPQTRSLGLLRGIRGGGGNSETQAQQSTDRTVYPFSYMCEGHLSGQYTLWVDTEQARKQWHEMLQHAKVLRSEVNDAGKVFDFTPLSLDTFYEATGYGAAPLNNEEYTGAVTCSTPFTTIDGRKLVAIGCEQGVWIGIRHEPSSLRKVLHVRGVTQIAVLEDFGIFLVLADKSLLAYNLDALVPTDASPHQPRSAAPQRLSVREIVFFGVGQVNGRTVVLYMKRKGMDSVFRVLEPIVNRNLDDQARPQRRAFGNLLSRNFDWFRIYKDFFIPTDATNVHFLKTKLAIVCAKGFEIMDLSDLKGGTIPIFEPAKMREKPHLQDLQKRCGDAKPLAMFRSTDSEFLLCYDTFGLYVDRHGEPNRDQQPIEWEGHPLEPRDIAFHPPYVLIVSRSFVEVRHIDTAKLVQIYTGKDLRCTWDGTGGMSHKAQQRGPTAAGWGDEILTQEPRIHICRRGAIATRAGTRGISQHIFELTPTLLLNNPLLNPGNTQDPNYFPPAPLDYGPGAPPPEMYDPSLAYAYMGGPSGTPSINQPNNYADRRSVSSSSTHTYPNAPHSPAFPTSPALSMPAPSPSAPNGTSYRVPSGYGGYNNVVPATDEQLQYPHQPYQQQTYQTSHQSQGGLSEAFAQQVFHNQRNSRSNGFP